MRHMGCPDVSSAALDIGPKRSGVKLFLHNFIDQNRLIFHFPCFMLYSPVSPPLIQAACREGGVQINRIVIPSNLTFQNLNDVAAVSFPLEFRVDINPGDVIAVAAAGADQLISLF